MSDTVEFVPSDLYQCPAYGMLWRVEKLKNDGRWGLRRLRRGGKGKLVGDTFSWHKPWAPFREPVVPGKLIYRTNLGTSVLISIDDPRNKAALGE